MSDINPFGLRMPPELKKTLEKEAAINGRSMNAEIVNRLQLSVEQQRNQTPDSYRVAEDSPLPYQARDDHERAMLSLFRRLSPEKQLALLSLFK